MQSKSIWFAMLSMLIRRLARTVSKYSKLLIGKIKGSGKKLPEEQ